MLWPFSGSNGVRDADRRKTFHPQPIRRRARRHEPCHWDCGHESDGSPGESELGGQFAKIVGWIGTMSVGVGVCANVMIQYMGRDSQSSPLRCGRKHPPPASKMNHQGGADHVIFRAHVSCRLLSHDAVR